MQRSSCCGKLASIASLRSQLSIRVWRNATSFWPGSRAGRSRGSGLIVASREWKANGWSGSTASTLLAGQRDLHDQVLPEFRSRAGEVLPFPAPLEKVARRAVAGACCLGCHSPHLLLPRTDLSHAQDKAG